MSIERINLVVDIGVPEISATKLSELNKFEYRVDPLKKNKLAANRTASPIPIQEFLKNLIFLLLL